MMWQAGRHAGELCSGEAGLGKSGIGGANSSTQGCCLRRQTTHRRWKRGKVLRAASHAPTVRKFQVGGNGDRLPAARKGQAAIPTRCSLGPDAVSSNFAVASQPSRVRSVQTCRHSGSFLVPWALPPQKQARPLLREGPVRSVNQRPRRCQCITCRHGGC